LKPNFEWDQAKAAANFKKHKVSFDEAATVFTDPYSITVLDPEHSMEEERYLNIGISDKGRVLVVSFVERQMNIRIISCRKATPAERRRYEESNE
jgi:uncharacterized DUF497 family protein